MTQNKDYVRGFSDGVAIRRSSEDAVSEDNILAMTLLAQVLHGVADVSAYREGLLSGIAVEAKLQSDVAMASNVVAFPHARRR